MGSVANTVFIAFSQKLPIQNQWVKNLLIAEKASLQRIPGANTYTGATTINAGTLKLGASGVIADTSAVSLANVASAILNLNNFSETIGSLAGGGTTGGNVSLGSATLTAGGDNSSTTYSGVMSGTGGITKAGSGTFTLGGANTYSGTTTIDAGTLSITNDNALGNPTTGSTVTSGATLNINGVTLNLGNGITLTLHGSGVNGVGSLTGTGTATITGEGGISLNSTIGVTGTLTISTKLTGSGNLTKVGSGTLILTNTNNDYSGSTIINSGTLRLGASGVIPNTSAVSLANAADTIFDLNNFAETMGHYQVVVH